MWGKDESGFRPLVERRFNPTCVGKRSSGGFGSFGFSVQPHVCGEKMNYELQKKDYDGSTPRVWGKDGLSDCIITNRRFNPTCVGKRLKTCIGILPNTFIQEALSDRFRKVRTLLFHSQNLKDPQKGSPHRPKRRFVLVWDRVWTLKVNRQSP